MTTPWNRFIATGSGQLAVRLMIEGLPYEFVSDPRMEQTTADGRVRVYALPEMGAGIVIEDSVNIPEAKLEAQGVSITIFETDDELVSRAFWFMPSIERFVAASVESDDETITLLSTGGIVDGDVVHIGTEAILVDDVPSATELDVTGGRAYWDTIAQKHWANEGAVPYALIANRPLRVRGRRAYIYGYADGDDPQGDGTQIWLGHVTSEPRCDDAGASWHIQIGSIAERLESKLGGGLDVPKYPRGIYYPSHAGLRVLVAETTAGGVDNDTDWFTGFFETQRDFVEALTDWLTTGGESRIADLGLASTLRAIETEDGRWTLQIVVGTGVTNFQVLIQSEQDGETSFDMAEYVDEDGALFDSISAGDVIYPRWFTRHEDDRLVPRGFFGESGDDSLHSPSDAATWPRYRLYLNSGVADDWVTCEIDWPSGDTREHAIVSAGVSAADNYIELEPLLAVAGERYGAFSPPAVNPLRGVATGNLDDFREFLLTESVDYANRGTAPFVTSSDIADWSAVIADAIRGRSWLDRRFYTLAAPVDLAEMLAGEWRLLNLFPVIESDGRIGVRILRQPNESTADATTIDEEIVSVGWSSIERGNQTINRVELKTGYVARDDEWTETTIDTVDITAYAQDHQDRPLTIEPRSRAAGLAQEWREIGENAVAEMALPVLGLFGYPHSFVDVHVSWKLFNLLIGDIVSFSAEHLPSYLSGVRPISGVVGIVVGRRWALGEAHGRLRILISFANVAGYSPTARVTGTADQGGNVWDLTINHTLYAPLDSAGAVLANVDTFIEVDHSVKIVKYDSETASEVEGTVTAVNTSTHVIRVAFNNVFVPGAFTWELMFQDYSNSNDTERKYAAIASSTALLAANTNPRTYGA